MGRLFPLEVLITSRPVPVVQRGFFVTGLMNDTNILVLHNIRGNLAERYSRISGGRLLSYCPVFWIEVMAIRRRIGSTRGESRAAVRCLQRQRQTLLKTKMQSPERQLEIVWPPHTRIYCDISPPNHLDSSTWLCSPSVPRYRRMTSGRTLQVVLGSMFYSRIRWKLKV